jgi:hypothetical protein
MTQPPPPSPPAPPATGLVVGGLGGDEHELLESGQEEVFSRTEVESGRIEHPAKAGSGSKPSDQQHTSADVAGSLQTPEGRP